MNKIMNLNTAQNDCVKTTLHQAIHRFLYGRNKLGRRIKTFVLPLAIPTGFGKTRIAIQGIFNYTENKKNIEGTVILWPQKKAHITDIWVKSKNWEKKASDGNDEPYQKIHWRRLIEENKNAGKKYNGKKMFYVLDEDDWTSSKAKMARWNIGITGPIFFIIDEWHGKKLIEKFQKFKSKTENLEERAEEFWRKTLLPNDFTKRPLFVLLVSATPISTTKNMDEKFLCKESTDDKEFADSIRTAYDAFCILTKIGYESNKFNVLKNEYNKLILNEVDKLKNSNKKECEFVRFNSEKFAEQYGNVLKSMAKKNKLSSPLVYFEEQKEIADDSENLKMKTLLKFVNSKQNMKKKFLIFCHHLSGVASKLDDYLNGKIENGFAYYLDREKNYGEHFTRITAIKRFRTIKDELRILIVTDKDSQGIDLHESNADIIHYELSWNPIRIIQRFGRVWRIKEFGEKRKSVHMTKPKAYYMPFTYSSEEEQVNRLRRRWNVLESLDAEYMEEKKVDRRTMRFTPISMRIALGERLTPEP